MSEGTESEQESGGGAHPLFEWCEPLGGTTCFPRLTARLFERSAGVTSADFAHFMQTPEGAQIMLLPSMTFHGAGHDRIRVTYGREETIPLLERWSSRFPADGGLAAFSQWMEEGRL